MAAAPDPIQLARIHFDAAMALVGAQQLGAWLSGAGSGVLSKAPTPVSASSGRGRKPGAVAAADERCTWTLTDGTQCKNRHLTDSTYCRIHLKQVHLVDDSATA